MKTVLKLVALLVTAVTLPTQASTAAEAMAAGARAMTRFDVTTKQWLRTQDPKIQQRVLCAALQATQDVEGLTALDCYAAAKAFTPAKDRAIAHSLERYQAGFGYTYPTANDVARAPAQGRAAVHQAIGCQRIRDRIAIQMDLMARGASGYWNMDQMRLVERQQCGENMAVMP